MVLHLREVLIEAASALANELRPGFPGEILVPVTLAPDRDPSCLVQYPAERS
jgi:hypothetical protein